MTSADVEAPGRWRHRYVAANGARFHVAIADPPTPNDAVRSPGAAPVVLFLHGFPEFWWAWRHQLPAFSAAGYRAAAMDLRGYGGSDKTPRGYDPSTLAADVSGVIAGLGVRRVVLVGQGWGGYIAWAVATAHSAQVAALCVVAAPHPRELLAAPWRDMPRGAATHLLTMQLPWIPERRIMRGSYVARHLATWASADSGFPSPDVAERYRRALALWPSPHCALEFHRWLLRSRLRADGRAFTKTMRRRVSVPVLHVTGADDPTARPTAVDASGRHVDAPYTVESMPHVGHFPHEEAPQRFNRVVLDWLARQSGES